MNWSECQSRDDIPLVLNEMGLTGIGVEIGVAEGYYSNTILNTWGGKKLCLVDLWRHQAEGYYDGSNLPDEGHEQKLTICERLMMKHPGRYQFYRMDSLEAAAKFPEFYFDFVYIDANHSYEAVTSDVRAWFPKVKLGGVIAGHDYLDPPSKTFGTKTAVDEFFLKRPEIVHIIATPPGGNPSWLVERVSSV